MNDREMLIVITGFLIGMCVGLLASVIVYGVL